MYIVSICIRYTYFGEEEKKAPKCIVKYNIALNMSFVFVDIDFERVAFTVGLVFIEWKQKRVDFSHSVPSLYSSLRNLFHSII